MDKDNQQQPEQPQNKPDKAYGKRPIWQWLVIYLILAVIVYGAVYYLFINNGDNGSGTDGLGY